MKHISTFVLRVEEVLAGAMLIAISALVFLSAIARTIGMPINWAQDISLLFFAWLTFIGADIGKTVSEIDQKASGTDL